MHPELEDYLLERMAQDERKRKGLGLRPDTEDVLLEKMVGSNIEEMPHYAKLVAAHGTFAEFTAAVKNAIGEISVAEADAGILKYREDLLLAIEADMANYDEEKKLLADLYPWRPMKSVPRDGTEVILVVEMRAGIPYQKLVGHWMPGGHCIEDHPPISEGWYFWNGCMFDKASKPLAWMPIPEFKPKEKQDGEGSGR